MNTTDAEIAGRLKLMPRIASVSVGINPYGSVEVTYGGNFMPFKPSDLLAFCRAVVERVQEKCRWKQDDTGDWFTRCGEGWTFTDGGVAENRIKFCPYCGKPIEAVEYKEPMEET